MSAIISGQFGSGPLVSVSYSSNGGSTYSPCLASSYLTSNKVLCSFATTFTSSPVYVFQVNTAGTLAGTATNTMAQIRSYPSVWDVGSYGLGLLNTLPTASTLGTSQRNQLMTDYFTSGFVGTGLVFKLVARGDGNSVIFDHPTVGLIDGSSSGKRDIYYASSIPVTFGDFQDGAIVTVPPGTEAYSDPVDYCVKRGQSLNLAFTFHQPSNVGVNNQVAYFSITLALGSPVAAYVTDTNDPLAYNKPTWTALSSNLFNAAHAPSISQVLRTVTVADCIPPSVTAISPVEGLAGVQQNFTLTGSSFGISTSIRRVSYKYSTIERDCVALYYLTSSSIVCTVGDEVPPMTSVKFVVFVSGMINFPTQTVTIKSEWNKVTA